MIATFQPEASFGRIFAAYGGVVIAGSILWGLVFEDGHVRPGYGTRLLHAAGERGSPMTTAEALLMGGAVAIVILLFMRRMYSSNRIYAAIVIGSLLLMTGSLVLARSQTTLQDSSNMRTMRVVR